MERLPPVRKRTAGEIWLNTRRTNYEKSDMSIHGI